MLNCLALKKSYGNIQVLKGIDMSVKQGEVVSITGESGAGKSTLLHLIGTLDKPDSGAVYFQDENITAFSSADLAKFRNQKLGFIFQFHQLLPEFSALENVCIPAWIKGISRSDSEKRALELLAYLGLEKRGGHKPSQLSGGEAQRVAVARALMNNPQLILADEPSGNLDSANAELLHKYFLKLRDDFGQTFVIVTHNLELAAMSDREIKLKDGLILSETEV